MYKVDYLSRRLRELREDKGLTQSQLAEYLEIGRASVSNYENGERIPDAELIIKFADFFNVTADYLLGRSGFKSYAQEYEYRRRLASNPDETSSSNQTDDLSPGSINFTNRLISIDANFAKIIKTIMAGDTEYNRHALSAFDGLLVSIDYIYETLQNDNNDDEMYYYINFLKKLKDIPLIFDDFGNIQSNQTQIKACSKWLNMFISFYVYSIINNDEII